MATPATPHDHSEPIEARTLEIDGKAYPFRDTYLVWSELATLSGLPATVVPMASSRSHLPVGIQVVGPYLEDRTTLRFAQLMEREFRAPRAMPRKYPWSLKRRLCKAADRACIAQGDTLRPRSSLRGSRYPAANPGSSSDGVPSVEVHSANARMTLMRSDLPSKPMPGSSGMTMCPLSTLTLSGKPP